MDPFQPVEYYILLAILSAGCVREEVRGEMMSWKQPSIKILQKLQIFTEHLLWASL